MKNVILLILLSAIIISCGKDSGEKKQMNKDMPVEYNFSKEFNDYWNSGKAELASYELSKARYGETHDGDAVLIFVVEPFLPAEQVKSEGLETDEKPERVMKLIKDEKFFTGIYPYSIMTSAFYPLNKNREGLFKVSMSSQDWCGQVYKQLNNRGTHLELRRFSYFQKEGDTNQELEKGLMEEELFSQIRIDPSNLPTGKFDIYPSAKYIRLVHLDHKKYSAEGKLEILDDEKGIHKYTVEYLNLDRKLEIEFESSFPHKITGWQETSAGISGKKLTTRAELKQDIHIAYWKHNSRADSTYRKFLGL